MNFNGERLKKARLYRNMTITELSEKINVTKQAISQFEKSSTQKGSISPKSDVFFSIVLALSFPKKFFEENDAYAMQIENTFFRALSTTRNLDKKTQEIKAEFVVRIYNFLNEYLDFPQLNLPDVSGMKLENLESVALCVREYWSIGNSPISNMINLLESNGIIISSFKVNNKKIDAFTQVHNTKGFEQFCVILGTDKQSMVRRSFDCAHELGHILLHNSLGDISLLENDEQREIEIQANQFAGAFLLPKDSFFNDLKYPNNLEYYINLKEKWKVSISAMIVRARQLERITNSEYQALMKKLSVKKWNIEEPFDDEWKPNEPILFRKSLDILNKNKIFTNRQFLEKLSSQGLSLNASDVEELLNLKKGYFDTVEYSIKDSILRLKKFT